MRVQTGVAGGARQGLVVFEGDVAAGFWVFVALGEAEVDDIDDVLVFARANEEIIGFDISVEEAILVHEFYSLELISLLFEGK